MDLHSPKTNSWSLKMDDWKTTFLLGQAYFRRLCSSWEGTRFCTVHPQTYLGTQLCTPAFWRTMMLFSKHLHLNWSSKISTSPRCCDKTKNPRNSSPLENTCFSPTTGMRKSRVNEPLIQWSLYQVVDSIFSKKCGGYTHPIWWSKGHPSQKIQRC